MMLKDFVAKTLLAVADGLAESREGLARSGAVVAGSGDGAPVQRVHFDVMVAPGSGSSDADRDIEVVEGANASASRVRFSVCLSVPSQAGEEAELPTDLEWE